MATSGSVNYNLTRDELVSEALRRLGVLEEGGTATANQLSEFAITLNIMLKHWQTHGSNLWVIKRKEITTVANQVSYTLGRSAADVTMDRPLEVIRAYRRETATAIDTELQVYSKAEYLAQGDKDSASTPLAVYYDPQLTNGVLYIWPTADATFVANNTISIIYRKPFDDMDAGSDDFEFPAEWYEPIVLGLMDRQSFRYGIPPRDRQLLKQEAAMALLEALSWDAEQHTSLFVQPDIGEW